jgi:hypothetical protein
VRALALAVGFVLKGGGCYLFDTMKKLEKKLKELQKNGYEQVSIIQILNWMNEIKRENRLKKLKT